MAKCLYSGDKPLGIVQSNAEDVEYSSGVSVKQKIDDISIWTDIGTKTSGQTLDITGYKELYLIPLVNGSVPFSPIHFIVENGTTYNSVYQSPSNNFTYSVEVTNLSTLLFTQTAITGWNSISLKVKGKK